MKAGGGGKCLPRDEAIARLGATREWDAIYPCFYKEFITGEACRIVTCAPPTYAHQTRRPARTARGELVLMIRRRYVRDALDEKAFSRALERYYQRALEGLRAAGARVLHIYSEDMFDAPAEATRKVAEFLLKP